MTLPLPRLAAFTIERERVSAWLNRYAHMPLRLCLAPAGSGKTTALVSYARSRVDALHYVHLKYRTEGRSLEDYLSDLFSLEHYSYEALLTAMGTCASIELIVDGLDRLTVHEQALLERLVYEVPAHVGLIYAGTMTSMAVHRLEAAGLATVLSRDDLLFTLQETRLLSDAFGLTARDEQLFNIHDHCNGWAVVLADILRATAEQETSLVDAYERWVAQRGRSFSAYLQEEIGRFPNEGRVLFDKVVQGEGISDQDLTLLEDMGAFILANGTSVRPYNVVSDLTARPTQTLNTRNMRVAIRMFGRFSVRCGDREVAWIRRRDQQIFRYIAVRPDGRVRKAEIINIFWPDADPHLAAQSLRTACSNIRKALAGVMEASMVEQLFVTEGQELVVNLEHAVVDVRRFKLHINEGNEADNDERLADALAHYAAAERLYRADLFGGEPEEAWFVPQREVYRDLVALARDRISVLRIEIGEFDSITEDLDSDAGISANAM